MVSNPTCVSGIICETASGNEVTTVTAGGLGELLRWVTADVEPKDGGSKDGMEGTEGEG